MKGIKGIYDTEPEQITYNPLSNGQADVWLRKNIQETTNEDNVTLWIADEVYFCTGMDEQYIIDNFETLYENGGDESELNEQEIDTDEALNIIMGVIS